MVMQYVKSGLSAGQGVILGNSYETKYFDEYLLTSH